MYKTLLAKQTLSHLYHKLSPCHHVPEGGLDWTLGKISSLKGL